MLQQFSLHNFKIFDDAGVALELGKITVLIGANRTGKSSLLQALLLLKQSAGKHQIDYTGPHYPVNGFHDLVHNRQSWRTINIALQVSIEPLEFETSPELAEFVPKSGNYRYGIDINQVGLADHAGKIEHDVGQWQGGWNRAAGPWAKPPEIQLAENAKVQLQGSQAIAVPLMLGGSVGPYPRMLELQAAFQMRFATVSQFLARLAIVPAVRGFANLAYGALAERPGLELTAVSGADAQAQLAANIMGYYPESTEDVSHWMAQILGDEPIGLRTRMATQNRVQPEALGARGSISLVNEGFGLNQLVAPLLMLTRARFGSLVAIEEPEIHLHPRAQAALCGVFVQVVKSGTGQLVLTTHSEHILVGLLSAVARGDLQAEDLRVYEVRRKENGASAVERLDVNEYGQVKGGLQGFLETDLDEIGEFLAARLGSHHE